MLSKRITELFAMLQCTNSDIARFSNCSPSNISRLKSGSREPEPGSRSILRLVRGIYRYADYENMLDMLCGLCGTTDSREEAMTDALVSWLYSEQEYESPRPVTPKSKQEQIERLQYFSERLDKVMALLDYSNSRLAADLNVDTSLISRYRSGIYHPNRNVEIKNHLCGLILSRAVRTGHEADLASLCGVGVEELDHGTLSDWLYGPDERRKSDMAESIFHSIDSFTPGPEIHAAIPERSSFQKAERYWGTIGMRSAVVRFLTETAEEGGELLLYSDEPLDWMHSDPKFFAQWVSLMTACLHQDVHIKIIHNINRGDGEMISAIKAWLPLYISGRIEPYIFRKALNARFHHTVFLRPGSAAIMCFYPSEMGENRWYDYITDRDQLKALRSGFRAMFDKASPFLKTFGAHQANVFWSRYYEHTGKGNAILKGLSVATMPEGLIESMLSHAQLDGQKKDEIIHFCRSSRKNLRRILENGELYEFICLPSPEEVTAGSVNVNFEAETNGLCLAYAPEEYAAHLCAVRELVQREKNYHLTLLPQIPFQDLQIFTMQGAAAVIRCRVPYTAFVFYNADLLCSVNYYCNMLLKQYGTDRTAVIQMLEKLL